VRLLCSYNGHAQGCGTNTPVLGRAAVEEGALRLKEQHHIQTVLIPPLVMPLCLRISMMAPVCRIFGTCRRARRCQAGWLLPGQHRHCALDSPWRRLGGQRWPTSQPIDYVLSD